MVFAHPIATGRVMNITIVARGMNPAMEHTPTHTKGKIISKP
jgi:hypothetical protein